MARSSSRQTTEVNAGSMADIAFLLLIFFLVTTTIPNDKGLMTMLPPKPDPNEPPPEVSKNDRNIFKIQANSKDQLLVEEEPLKDVDELGELVRAFVLNFGKPTNTGQDLYNSLPGTLKNYVNLNGKDPASSDDPTKAIVSFKADRGTSYDLYIQVLDQINGAYNQIYGERIGMSAEEFLRIDKKDPIKKDLYEKARQDIPRAISIAEPNKIGG